MPAASIHADRSRSHNARLSAPLDLQVDQIAADQLLSDTNALLSKLGFGDRALTHYVDLVASISSMSVALYEKLFQFRLRDVERVPCTRQDYEHNAQLVANALRSALLEQEKDDLTGETLCAGELRSIRQLLTMLEQVYSLLYEESEEVGERLRDVSLSSFESAATTQGLAISKRSVPPKLVRKESESKKDDLNRTQVRDAHRNKVNKGRRKTSQAGTLNQREVRTGRAVDRRTLTGGKNSRPQSADPIAVNNKKRSRLRGQSFRASSNKSTIAANDAANARATCRKLLRISTRNGQRYRENDHELLATKANGRFVTAVLNTSSDDDKPCMEKASMNDSSQVFFGGVSSVHHVSDGSMHCIGNDSVLAQGLASLSFEDAELELKDDRNLLVESTSDRENAIPNQTLEPVACQQSVHQQEAQKDDFDFRVGPVQKEVAQNESPVPERRSALHTTRQEHVNFVYPRLLKTTRLAVKSKAQAQYGRYKLTLKNHLQELRQQETAQRQHLERAFKSSEHLANVNKIRSRRFEQDVRLHRIAIGWEAKNKEEKQLRETMNRLLGLEKEKLREEHRLTASVLKQIQREHTEREQAVENFYANQIQLVKERTRREVVERELVEKAQRAASDKVMRELRREKEHQLAGLLQKKQHLEETRRFRHASHLAQLLETTKEHSVKRTDVFYTAARSVRERHKHSKRSHTQRRTSLDPAWKD